MTSRAKKPEVYRWEPDYVVGPGPILAEWLADNGLTTRTAMAAVFREQVHRDGAAERVQKIIDDGATLTEPIAEWLAAIPGCPSKAFWMALEHNYRVGLAAGKTDAGRDGGGAGDG